MTVRPAGGGSATEPAYEPGGRIGMSLTGMLFTLLTTPTETTVDDDGHERLIGDFVDRILGPAARAADTRGDRSGG